MMRTAFTLFLMIWVSVVSSANVTLSKLDMESRINERVREIVNKVDPSALVRVTIDLKKVESTLPFLGIEAEVTPLEDGESLGFSSIDKINVLVLTQDKEVPQWIRREIRSSIAIDGVDVRLNVRKAGGRIEPPKEPMVSAFEQFMNDKLPEVFTPLKELTNLKDVKIGFWGLIGTLAFCLLLIVFGIFSLSRRIDKTILNALDNKLIPALSNIKISQMGGRKESRADTPAAGPQQITMPTGKGSEFEDFTPESLIGLLTDCYWTEADTYANHVWSNLKPTQREQVLRLGFVDENYFSFLRQVGKEDFGYHNDAWYLDFNNKFDFIDQEELLTWLKANPTQSGAISPMRMDFLDLTLKDRLKFNNAEEAEIDFDKIKFEKGSAKRKLPIQLRIRKLSLDDESYLFENPDQVSPTARGQMASLVWLALCELDDRQKIVAELDARQLAEAWVGPEEVLAKIREAISDKKFEMVEHFQKETDADRGSEAYLYLVDAGLDAYNPENESEAA